MGAPTRGCGGNSTFTMTFDTIVRVCDKSVEQSAHAELEPEATAAKRNAKNARWDVPVRINVCFPYCSFIQFLAFTRSQSASLIPGRMNFAVVAAEIDLPAVLINRSICCWLRVKG
jgi:hypothetical protein